LCGSGAEDVLQLLIHLVHPVSRGCRQRVQERSRRGHVLAGPAERGKLPLLAVDRRSPLRLERGLALV
jgi:hypothetical protein